MRTESPQPTSRRRFVTGVVTGGLLGSILAGSLSLYAHTGQGPGWFGRGHGRHGMHRVHGGERAAFATDWILRHLDASDEQHQQVKAIIQSAMTDLQAAKAQHRLNRQALLEALGQPTIDRQVLDTIRQSTLQLAETASDRLLSAIADAAEVLTPEQRAQLRELAEQWHH